MAFEYVSINADVFGIAGLNDTDRIILSFMRGFNGRFSASNRYTGECLGMSEKKVERSLTRLRRKGLVTKRTPTNQGVKPPHIEGTNPRILSVKPPHIEDIYYRDNKPYKKEDNKGEKLLAFPVKQEGEKSNDVVRAIPNPAGCPLSARRAANMALGVRAVQDRRREAAREVSFG